MMNALRYHRSDYIFQTIRFFFFFPSEFIVEYIRVTGRFVKS